MSRPKSDKSKNMRFEIRLNSETADKLQYCADKLNTTKSDVIHRGIDLVKAELDKKNNTNRSRPNARYVSSQKTFPSVKYYIID